MATSKEFLSFILDQLSALDGVEARAMMGEYLLYYRGKLVADLCDNRLLVKPVPAALSLLPHAPREAPYEGAKEMLLVTEVDDPAFLSELFRAIYDELPMPKEKKRRSGL